MCSPELEALYGIAPGAFEKTYRAWLQRIVPEDAAGLEAMLRACFEQRTEEVGYEFRILMPNGTRRWFEGKWRCAFAPNGRPRRLAGIQVDIDDRKRSELNARFRSTLNEALSLISDPESILESAAGALGAYLQVDECAFFAMGPAGRPVECEHRWRAENSLVRDAGGCSGFWTPDELARAGGQHVTHLDDSRRLAPSAATASLAAGIGAWAIAPFAREGRWIASLRLVSAQPRVWHATELALIEMVLARVWPLVERARSERAVAAAEAKIRQTLAERRAELERLVAERTARLQDTVAELESFSYSISHDLRAPLRAMTGFGELLAEEYGDRIGPEGRDYLRRIITASRRMDRLTQDVLVYSRVSRTELPLVPVDLEALVTGIVESYPQFHAELADVIVRGPFPRVLGNEAALMQCVSNLMSNAVKFVAPGVRPRVEVSAETLGERVRLAVLDNGIGIPPEARGKIFGIFERLHNGYEGTGIGLAVVRRAMERMGGSVDFCSEPGKGSRFCLELTLAS
jgi:PAS domain S-box-containing protein